MITFKQFITENSSLISTKWKFTTGENLFKGQTLEKGDIVTIDSIDSAGIHFSIPRKSKYKEPKIGEQIPESRFKTGDFVIAISNFPDLDRRDRDIEAGQLLFIGFNTMRAGTYYEYEDIKNIAQRYNIDFNKIKYKINNIIDFGREKEDWESEEKSKGIFITALQVIDENRRDYNVLDIILQSYNNPPEKLVQERQNWLNDILKISKHDRYMLYSKEFKQNFIRVS
jgi:hypothetical protein